PGEQERVVIVGREYARGALHLNEAAALLKADPIDVVVLLEARGYVRSVERITLEDDERTQLYARMRADRLSRAGKFDPTPEQIARDVIASERIEGIDARPWLRPESSRDY